MTAFSAAAAGPAHLACEVIPAHSPEAADYADALCAAVAESLALKFGASVGRAPAAQLKTAAKSADGRGQNWALLRVSVSGAHTAKARLSFGTAAQLASGTGRSGAEVVIHISDAALNRQAAAGHASALMDSAPR